MNRILLAIVAMLLVVGCKPTQTQVPPPVEPRNDPFGRAQINFASEDLKSSTAVQTPTTRRDEAGLLYVTVPIRSTTSKHLYIEYRATFFDQTGGVVGQTTWIRHDLVPMVQDQFSFNSLTPRATDFQIDIRYGWVRK